MTNEPVFDLTRLPASLLVVGGGPIGVESGQVFARLGSKVTIIEGLGRLVPKEDPEVSATLADVLQSEGITVATNATFVKASRAGQKKVATVKQGDQSFIPLGLRQRLSDDADYPWATGRCSPSAPLLGIPSGTLCPR